MSIFTEQELEYLSGERRLARLATVGKDGTPHISPVGWAYNPVENTIEIRGYNLEATKKFRDIARTGRAAVVIDDVLPPWQPRGVEIRGRAEARRSPKPLIAIHPERIIGWGLDTHGIGVRNSRQVKVSA
jgi:pyridoxamine 5'-phosphate oxidase family protein